MLNMRRTSLWTASQPSLVVNNQEGTPRSSLRPQSTGFGYISEVPQHLPRTTDQKSARSR